METSKLDGLKTVARGYLLHYRDRYNFFFPDSYAGHSGFCEWAMKYAGKCEVSAFERGLLKKFTLWLETRNSNPNRRLDGLMKADLEDFLEETSLLDLLEPAPSSR